MSQSEISALLAPSRNTVAPMLFAPAVQFAARAACPFRAEDVALSRIHGLEAHAIFQHMGPSIRSNGRLLVNLRCAVACAVAATWHDIPVARAEVRDLADKHRAHLEAGGARRHKHDAVGEVRDVNRKALQTPLWSQAIAQRRSRNHKQLEDCL